MINGLANINHQFTNLVLVASCGMNMKNKCKYCFSRLNPESSVCGVCKIDAAKDKSALTPAEKKAANRCRTLYTIGFLSVVGGLMGLFLLLPSVGFFLGGQKNRNLATPSASLPFYVASMLILFVTFPFFGFALRRYKKWCYRGGILLYSSLILLNLPGFHVVPIFITSVFLYWLASPPSREILWR